MNAMGRLPESTFGDLVVGSLWLTIGSCFHNLRQNKWEVVHRAKDTFINGWMVDRSNDFR